MLTIDQIDLKILEHLQHDSQTPIKELCTVLNLSQTPVYERIKRLEKEGIIKSYVALLDKSKVGKSMVVFCNVMLKEHATPFLKKFEQEVLSLQEVVECYYISGNYDYLLKVIVTGMADYQHFIVNKLAALDNIGNVQSSFVMTEIKDSTAIPLT